MDQDRNIELMINSKRIKLSLWTYLAHYAFVIIFLLPMLLGFTGVFNGYRSINSILTTFWPFLMIALTIFIIQYNRLKFTIIKTSLSNAEVLDILIRSANENSWKIRTKTGQIFQASAKGILGNLAFVGELITIIVNEKKIYINCICDPNLSPNLFSFGNNKRHKRLIIETIEKASAQQRV